jgi:NAD-dependent deacetylase
MLGGRQHVAVESTAASEAWAIVAGALADGGDLVVLTGAGISAESGVPTFRGPEGYWTIGSRNYHAQDLATAAAFRRMPRDIWRWYLFRRGVCRAAQPNAGHYALVALERALPGRFTLVTQNVDGLHLRAGSSRDTTLQIHGNIDFLRCARECTAELFEMPEGFDTFGRDDPLDDAAFARLVCPHCDGPARPHVLWFDEYYDEPRFRADSAMAAARDAAVLVVVGTAGATNLPTQIGLAVARAGRPIIDINTDDNPFAELAARTDGRAVRGNAATLLPALHTALVQLHIGRSC